MMRYFLTALFTAVLALQGFGQILLDDNELRGSSVTTNQLSGSELGLNRVKESDQPADLFTNRIESAPLPEPETTNTVTESKVDFLMSTGVEYTDEGEYEQAEKAYLRALAVDDQNPEIIFRLGSLYVQMDRFKDAARNFKELTDRFPENPMAHNNLAWCYATGPEIRNQKLALRHAREALLYDPLNPSIWNTLAEAYYVGGEYDQALQAAEYAVELLRKMNVKEEQIQKFVDQRTKIMQAQAARKLLEEPDDEE